VLDQNFLDCVSGLLPTERCTPLFTGFALCPAGFLQFDPPSSIRPPTDSGNRVDIPYSSHYKHFRALLSSRLREDMAKVTM
jgi:hypothetical protein